MSRLPRLVPALLPALVLALVLGPLVAGCSEEPGAGYCDAVEEHQESLGQIIGAGGSDALLDALGDFRELADAAPPDIADEWAQLIGSTESLRDALGDAGVDPATYDRDKPPAGLSAADKAKIDAAAEDLAGAQTSAALSGLEQQARDVCQTQLYL